MYLHEDPATLCTVGGLNKRAGVGAVWRGHVIIVTNALGLGIDVPDIRVVMHVEMPFTMADYAQQSERSGRDGQRSEATVVGVVIPFQELLRSRSWIFKMIFLKSRMARLDDIVDVGPAEIGLGSSNRISSPRQRRSTRH